MPKLEIHPFSDDFRGDAAALLADRHARHRAAEPLLAEVEDFGTQITGEGAVATRDGKVIAYVVAEAGPERADVGLAGSAASEPEALRDVYAHLAATWPSRHAVLVAPATDTALIDPWFRLAFGCQFMTAVQEVAPLEARDFGGVIRPSTPDDLAATAGFDRMLYSHQASSPSFSGIDVDALDFEDEWHDLWSEEEFPYHLVAELDGRIVGHTLLYLRPKATCACPSRTSTSRTSQRSRRCAAAASGLRSSPTRCAGRTSRGSAR